MFLAQLERMETDAEYRQQVEQGIAARASAARRWQSGDLELHVRALDAQPQNRKMTRWLCGPEVEGAMWSAAAWEGLDASGVSGSAVKLRCGELRELW
jgi:hypothetical protein